MSDAGSNFVSEKFRYFCRSINVKQAVSSAYHHQSNGQVRSLHQIYKVNVQKMHQVRQGQKHSTVASVHIMSIGQGLPSLVTIMFNRQVRGIMPVIDQKPLWQDHDDNHHIKLVERQIKKNDNDTSPVFSNIPIGSALAVQGDGWQPHGPMEQYLEGETTITMADHMSSN